MWSVLASRITKCGANIQARTSTIHAAPCSHMNDDGFPIYCSIDLLGSSDIQVPQLALQLLVGCLKIEQRLQQQPIAQEGHTCTLACRYLYFELYVKCGTNLQNCNVHRSTSTAKSVALFTNS